MGGFSSVTESRPFLRHRPKWAILPIEGIRRPNRVRAFTGAPILGVALSIGFCYCYRMASRFDPLRAKPTCILTPENPQRYSVFRKDWVVRLAERL